MCDPLITVVVPVYQVKPYLNRCLASIAAQTYSNMEVILVDDGSTDGSAVILDRWAKEHENMRVIHQENRGLSAARNRGIDESLGEYITFVDSDDWVTEDYVEYLYQILKENQADLAMAGHLVTSEALDTDGKRMPEGKMQCLTGREFLLKVMKIGTQENVQYSWAKLYKNFKDTHLRFPEGYIDEDVPTTFLYGAGCNRVVMSDKIIYFYYQNSESILRRCFYAKRFDLVRVWEMIVEYARENCDEEIAKYALYNLYRAHFGILCNINTEQLDEKEMDEIRRKEKMSLTMVKKHRRELLELPMPRTRKFFVNAFCINYKLAGKLLRLTGKRA